MKLRSYKAPYVVLLVASALVIVPLLMSCRTTKKVARASYHDSTLMSVGRKMIKDNNTFIRILETEYYEAEDDEPQQVKATRQIDIISDVHEVLDDSVHVEVAQKSDVVEADERAVTNNANKFVGDIKVIIIGLVLILVLIISWRWRK